MTLLRMELDLDNVAKDARLEFAELRRVRERAQAATLRRLQTIARRAVRRTVPIRARSVSRRVRAYVKGGRLWVGADARYAPLASSLRPPRVRLGRRRGNRPRTVTIDGRLIEGGFVPIVGRLRGRSFRRLEGGGIEALRVDVRPEMEAGFRTAASQFRNVYDLEFLAAANRAARNRRAS